MFEYGILDQLFTIATSDIYNCSNSLLQIVQMVMESWKQTPHRGTRMLQKKLTIVSPVLAW